MPFLVAITGPIAAGKNTVAELLTERWVRSGLTVVLADVDDIAAMIEGPGAARGGLWFAAHQAHGALVGQWMRSAADVVISVGPVYSPAEQDAFFGQLPTATKMLRVVVDAPLATTWGRVTDDATRGRSRDRDFHEAAHARFRALLPDIPVDLLVDSAELRADEIVDRIIGAADIAG